MILKASQRSGAGQLAAHLLNDRDNDHVRVADLRGFVADDLHGALADRQPTHSKAAALRERHKKERQFMIREAVTQWRRLAMVSRTKLACRNNRKRGTCSNTLMFGREELERLVLHTLHTHLMPPRLCLEFSRKYIERTNRHRKEQDILTKGWRDELSRIERQVSNLVDAIKNGVDPALIRDEINAAHSRKAELSELLKDQPVSQPLIHGAMAEYYHANVQRLIELLEHESHREEAAHIVRSLIDKVVLTENSDRTKLVVDLHGNLAGILQIAARREAIRGYQINGGLNHIQATEIEQVRAVVGCSRDWADAGDGAMQSAVVAGA